MALVNMKEKYLVSVHQMAWDNETVKYMRHLASYLLGPPSILAMSGIPNLWIQ